MRGSVKTVSLAVLALLLMGAVPAPVATAQVAYSQRLSVDIAGDSALWYMTFAGINGSSTLSALESTPGLVWYNITAVDTAGWKSAYQLFGPSGYNLIPVPFLPSEGVFLTVGSNSFASASSAAAALDSYLLTAFVSYSNSTGSSVENYTFYSPLSFADVVPKTLLTFVPSEDGGFASAVNVTSLATSGSPIVVLEGVKSSSGFEHSLVIGSIYSTALTSKNEPNVLKYFGTSISYIEAGKFSSSSAIDVRVLDGLISSKDDDAKVVNDTSTFSSSYVLSLKQDEEVKALNATIMQQPIGLLAYRTVSQAVLFHGDNMSVTVTMTDLSSSSGIKILNFTDGWWQTPKYRGLFKLVSNVTSIFPTTIAAGDTETPVYFLEYVGNATERIVIPPSVISYTFTQDGATFQGRAVLNPVPISLGESGADVFSYATFNSASDSSGSVGDLLNMTVTAVNEGNVPATATIAGKALPGLAANGGKATANETLAAQSLTDFDQAAEYSVKYESPLDPSVVYNATTNAVTSYFSQTSMPIGFPSLSVTEYVGPLATGGAKLVLTFSAANEGTVKVTSFTAEGVLPAGLGCGTAAGNGITCSSGRVQLAYSSIPKNSSETARLVYDMSTARNFIIGPMSFTAESAGITLRGFSSAVAVPTGLVTTKRFEVPDVFQGMTSGVNMTVSNAGPFTVYNATIGSSSDSFDRLVSGSVGSQTYAALSPGAVKNFSYSVSATSGSGGVAPSNATSEFYFGGVLFQIQNPVPDETVFKPLSVSVSTAPASPIEGKAFKVSVEITNPSNVTVSDVTFILPLGKAPSLSQLTGLTAPGGTLTVYNATLSPRGDLTASVEVVAGSGTSVNFDSASLTFSYGGQTLKGTLPSGGISVGENVTTRYLIPIALVFLAMLATSYYVRRRASPTGATSRR